MDFIGSAKQREMLGSNEPMEDPSAVHHLHILLCCLHIYEAHTGANMTIATRTTIKFISWFPSSGLSMELILPRDS